MLEAAVTFVEVMRYLSASLVGAYMPHYFFDTRDDGQLIRDDIGLELPDVPAAARAAARSLAELALEVLPACSERCLGVDVRDESDDPILSTELTFRAVLLKQQAT